MAVFGITTEREILKNIFPTRSDTTAAQVVVLFNDDEEREEFVISDPSQKVYCRIHTLSLFIFFVIL
jgi:hypothetical protein